MTFEGEIFPSFGAAREHMLGSGDSYQYYNPKTGRPIKQISHYTKVVLYSYNDHFGYKGMVMLEKTTKGIVVTRELFDQSGESSFNDMWENIKYGVW